MCLGDWPSILVATHSRTPIIEATSIDESRSGIFSAVHRATMIFLRFSCSLTILRKINPSKVLSSAYTFTSGNLFAICKETEPHPAPKSRTLHPLFILTRLRNKLLLGSVIYCVTSLFLRDRTTFFHPSCFANSIKFQTLQISNSLKK